MNTFAYKGCKITMQKKIVLGKFCLIEQDFFWYQSLSLRLMVFLPPTFQLPMSKLFRFSEYLGKSNGKKWSQIGKLLFIKGVKLPLKKSQFYCKFSLLAGFFGIGATIRIGREILFLLYTGFLKRNPNITFADTITTSSSSFHSSLELVSSQPKVLYD